MLDGFLIRVFLRHKINDALFIDSVIGLKTPNYFIL